MTSRSKRARARRERQKKAAGPSLLKSLFAFLLKLVMLALAGGVVAAVILSMSLGFFVWRLVPESVQHIILKISDNDGNNSKILYLNIDGHGQKYEVVSVDSELWSLLRESEKISEHAPGSLLEESLYINRLVHQVWEFEVPAERIEQVSSGQVVTLLSDAAWSRVPSNLTTQQKIWLGWLMFRSDPTYFSFDTLETIQEWQGPTSFLSLGFSESCSVAVINTTRTRGLATTFAQMYQNSGVRVVRITDSPMTRPESKVAMRPDADCLPESKALQQVVMSDKEVEFNAQLSDQYRAEVVVLLGRDISQAVTEFRDE